MGILLKIVYRNLKEHKVKTLIIGLIIAFGMYILVAGNSIIDTVTAGIGKNFIEYNTGHIAVFPASLENPSLVGGGPEMMDDAVVPIIRDFDSVLDHLLSSNRIKSVSPQISGMATIQFGGEGSGFTQLLGVNPERYREFFPDSIQLLSGRFLKEGEEGIVLATTAIEMLEESTGDTVDVGDKVILTSTSQVSGIKIREVPVVGIYEASVASQMMTSYIDGENMRALNGMTQITDVAAVLTEDEIANLGEVDEDSLFGSDDGLILVEDNAVQAGDENFKIFGGDDSRELYNAVNPDAWHYLLIRLDDESQMRRMVRQLNEEFDELGLEVTAYTWIDAAGQVAEITSALRLIFNVIILIIAVVAVIVIMNTLVISVTERIGEIGTMRAIGAQKSFVRRMIIMETFIIAIFFGGLGILLGLATIIGIGVAQIETENMILQMLAGGSIIKPVISAGSVIISLVGMTAAGVLASLYPASLALRIEPRQAMATK
ncbi:MAG: ABC transporter permease [Spirochaetales bacterium]|jgi:putative ABC transport system permease protein|nr:ABC transporter permease [Spirochaetales bacterium]